MVDGDRAELAIMTTPLTPTYDFLESAISFVEEFLVDLPPSPIAVSFTMVTTIAFSIFATKYYGRRKSDL